LAPTARPAFQTGRLGDAFKVSDIFLIILQLAKIGHSEERLQTSGGN